jgi:N-hydroxyarylamine O-acetyltransferase
MALDAFGFERRPLLARSHTLGRLFPRTHLLNLVHIDGRDWIADVGFGSNQIRAPMPLELDRIEVRDGQPFRLTDCGDFGTLLQARDESGWQNLYSFDMGRVWPVDIEMGNYFASTHPDIIFTWARVAALHKPSGKTTLMDFCLREMVDGAETVTTLEPGPAYLHTIKTKFGIVIDQPYEALKPIGHQPSEHSFDFTAPAE